MTKRPENFDIIFRYTDMYDGVDTAKEHINLCNKHGFVWLGKVGRGISPKTQEVVNEGIHRGTIPTFYLTHRVGEDYETYKAHLAKMASQIPKESHLIPRYYRDHGILNRVETWFKLTGLQPITKTEASKLLVATTGCKVLNSLRRGAKSILFVKTESTK